MNTCMPFKTPFVWLVWASNVKDDTLYTLGKNIVLERKLRHIVLIIVNVFILYVNDCM